MWLRSTQWEGYTGRVNALDVGRGIAIFSVIYGHALAPWFMGAGDHFSEGAFLQWKFGASFMMVFFFFLSGVGWREEKSFAVTMRQAAALVLIAWMASAMFDVVRLLATWAGFANALGVAPLDLVHFLRGLARMAVLGDAYSLSALWFLAALGVVRVMAALVTPLGRMPTVLFAGLLLIASLVSSELGFRNIYQLNLIGIAFLAFIAGHAARHDVRTLERSPTAAYALLLVGGAVALATFHLNEGCRWNVAAQCGQAWLNDRFGVSMIIGQFGNLPLFALTAIAGVGFALALSILLARFGGALGRRLDAWGRNSLNLLIVNALFLHLANPHIERWIAPRVDGDNIIFFALLLTLTMAANLVAVHALSRPLRKLASAANALAREGVNLGQRAIAFAIVAMRRHRVSQGHE